MDRAFGVRVPAEGQKLERVVAVDQVARVAVFSEMEVRRERAGVEQDAAQAGTDLFGPEGRRWNCA